MLFVPCPKQGNEIKGIVLNRVCIVGLLCAKQGQGFKPSVAHLYAILDECPPTPPRDSGLLTLCLLSVTKAIYTGKNNTGLDAS